MVSPHLGQFLFRILFTHRVNGKQELRISGEELKIIPASSSSLAINPLI